MFITHTARQLKMLNRSVIFSSVANRPVTELSMVILLSLSFSPSLNGLAGMCLSVVTQRVVSIPDISFYIWLTLDLVMTCVVFNFGR